MIFEMPRIFNKKRIPVNNELKKTIPRSIYRVIFLTLTINNNSVAVNIVMMGKLTVVFVEVDCVGPKSKETRSN